MRRVLSSIALALLCGGGAIAAPAPAGFTVESLPSPTSTGALLGSLAAAADGTVWLGWAQHSGHVTDVRCARWGPTGNWSAARTIAPPPSITPGALDGPVLAIAGDGTVYALMADRGGAWLTHSSDAGATWAAPAAWPSSGEAPRAFSLTPLAGGGVLATWLGRGDTGGGTPLYGRVIGVGSATTHLVDGAAADAGPAAVAAFLDGGARLAYRRAGIGGGIVTARLAQGRWYRPELVASGRQSLHARPADGPRLATDGSRMAAAWFASANDGPRIEATFSPDAGERWLLPLRIDEGHPAGPLDVVLLRDRTILVTWLEANGSLWLRRVSPEFSLAGQVELASPGTAAPAVRPQMALVRDYGGDRGDAAVVVVYAQAGSGRIGAIRVTIAEGALLAAERNCDCLPTPAELRGFAIRGRIVSVDAAAHRVRVMHDEVPGVFAAGEDDFEAAIPLLAQAHLGQPFLGHIAQGHAGWQLLDARYLGAPVGQ